MREPGAPREGRPKAVRSAWCAPGRTRASDCTLRSLVRRRVRGRMGASSPSWAAVRPVWQFWLFSAVWRPTVQ
eukprot:1020742-Pyramimonas_sp.AAC.1